MLPTVVRHAAREALAIAFEGLVRYKLRTALSVLGVVLGVAAVIAMMSVSEGARREALTQVELLGLDNIVVRARPALTDDDGRPKGRGLTTGDAETLPSLVPLSTYASPLIDRYVLMQQGSTAVMGRAVGVRSSFQSILRLRPALGRLLSPVDDRTAAHVCVLGGALARSLFGYREAVGQHIRIDRAYYEVVGTLAGQSDDAHAPGALAWRDLGQVALVPLPALTGKSFEVAPDQRIDELWIQTSDGQRVDEVGRIVSRALIGLHGGAEDFDVVVPKELLAQRYRTQRTFGIVVGSVAVLALVVGGIGIMNILLTSVMERTREIGVRRAVGATRRDVTVQFLLESLLMTLGGGALGIVIGAIVSLTITAYAGWATYVSIQAIALGFFISVTVGLVFGSYPAVKAARLAPVEALHYE